MSEMTNYCCILISFRMVDFEFSLYFLHPISSMRSADETATMATAGVNTGSVHSDVKMSEKDEIKVVLLRIGRYFITIILRTSGHYYLILILVCLKLILTLPVGGSFLFINKKCHVDFLFVFRYHVPFLITALILSSALFFKEELCYILMHFVYLLRQKITLLSRKVLLVK